MQVVSDGQSEEDGVGEETVAAESQSEAGARSRDGRLGLQDSTG